VVGSFARCFLPLSFASFQTEHLIVGRFVLLYFSTPIVFSFTLPVNFFSYL
jgi:hypothetical protein